MDGENFQFLNTQASSTATAEGDFPAGREHDSTSRFGDEAESDASSGASTTIPSNGGGCGGGGDGLFEYEDYFSAIHEKTVSDEDDDDDANAEKEVPVGGKSITSLNQLLASGADEGTNSKRSHGLWWSFLFTQMENDPHRDDADERIFSVSPDSFLTCLIFQIKSICQVYGNDDVFNYVSLCKILNTFGLAEKKQAQPSEYDRAEDDTGFDELQQKIIGHKFSTTCDGDIITRALLLAKDTEINNEPLVVSQTTTHASSQMEEFQNVDGLLYEAKRLADNLECEKIHFSGTVDDWRFIGDLVDSIMEKSANVLVYVNKHQAIQLTQACDRLMEIVDTATALKNGFAVVEKWNNVLHFHWSQRWEFSGWFCNLAVPAATTPGETTASILLPIEKVAAERATFAVGEREYQLVSEIRRGEVELTPSIVVPINECRLVLAEVR